MRHVFHRFVLRSPVALLIALPFAWAAGCGGVTDLYSGPDSGAGTGAKPGSGGMGGDVDVHPPSGGGVTSGGGAPTGGGGLGASGGAAGTGGAVVCGGTECPPAPQLPIGQVDDCCAGDKCGLTTSLLGNQCIELNQPGTVDGTCPDQNFQGFPLKGCCKPDDKCGVFDTFLGLGCVNPEQFGGPPSPNCGVAVDAGTGGIGGTGGMAGQAGTGGGPTDGGTVGQVNCGTTNPDICTTSENCCVLNPGLDYCSDKTKPCACTQSGCEITTVSCDGAEDCPGQICCGTFSFQQQTYTKIQCQNTCNAQNEREICHIGDKCSNPSQSCSNSNFLPPYLHRCN